MMIKRILTICAALTAGVAGISVAQAQHGYTPPSGAIYTPVPTPYPGGPGDDYDRSAQSAPNFDSLDERDARSEAARRLQGPVLSPDDPRYGRPMEAPATYSERAAPTGPVLSPDDPRYGQPASPPPVIYANRPDGPQQSYPVDPNAPRPPDAIGSQANVTGAVPPAADGSQNRPMTVASLPPEEQPDVGPTQLPPNLRRQEVSFVTKEPAGTIVVDTAHTYLYYVLGNGRAIRYGVRVGRDGFTWSGVQKITRKKEWPDWYPPSEMIERQPYLPRFMAGGPGNPLGARAMYLGNTVYRIHGTNQPSTIGKFVSSGCIGMLNEDVSDLFDRVKVGTRVVVLPGGPPPSPAVASAAGVPGSAADGAQASAAPNGTSPTVVPPLPTPVTVR